MLPRKSYLNLNSLITFYYRHVYPLLNYDILLPGTAVRFSDIYKSQKRKICFISNKYTWESYRPLFARFKLLTLLSIYILELLSYVYKNKKNIILNSDYHDGNTRKKDVKEHLKELLSYEYKNRKKCILNSVYHDSNTRKKDDFQFLFSRIEKTNKSTDWINWIIAITFSLKNLEI